MGNKKNRGGTTQATSAWDIHWIPSDILMDADVCALYPQIMHIEIHKPATFNFFINSK